MFGADSLWGARNRQLYYSRVKFNYEKPYRLQPRESFSTTLDYSVDYGETDGVTSANRMDGSLKSAADIGHHLYVYAGGGGGYDEIRKIDLRYEAGPGLGLHLLTNPKYQFNIEAGANYQEQQRTLGGNQANIFGRAGEDLTWKISERLTFTEKFEYFNNLENYDEFRFRMDSTLSFAVWKNVSLNLSLIDLFDTNPAPTVNRNELQLRSSLGLTF